MNVSYGLVGAGGLGDEPFLLPSAPFTPVESCEGTVALLVLDVSPPTPVLPEDVPVEELLLGWAAGPFLPPVSPWTPGPELCGDMVEPLPSAVFEVVVGCVASATLWLLL